MALRQGGKPGACKLPGAKVIDSGVEIPDMKWIWGFFGEVISLGSWQITKLYSFLLNRP